jgi:hypothetical protein
MPSENDDDPLSALKRGDLNVHSARMELVQNTSNQPGRYIGNGYIKQKEDGVIEFTLDAAEVGNDQAYSALLLSPMTGQSGTLIQADQAYTLIATDCRGIPGKQRESSISDFKRILGRYAFMAKLMCCAASENSRTRFHPPHYHAFF